MENYIQLKTSCDLISTPKNQEALLKNLNFIKCSLKQTEIVNYLDIKKDFSWMDIMRYISEVSKFIHNSTVKIYKSYDKISKILDNIEDTLIQIVSRRFYHEGFEYTILIDILIIYTDSVNEEFFKYTFKFVYAIMNLEELSKHAEFFFEIQNDKWTKIRENIRNLIDNKLSEGLKLMYSFLKIFLNLHLLESKIVNDLIRDIFDKNKNISQEDMSFILKILILYMDKLDPESFEDIIELLLDISNGHLFTLWNKTRNVMDLNTPYEDRIELSSTNIRVDMMKLWHSIYLLLPKQNSYNSYPLFTNNLLEAFNNEYDYLKQRTTFISFNRFCPIDIYFEIYVQLLLYKMTSERINNHLGDILEMLKGSYSSGIMLFLTHLKHMLSSGNQSIGILSESITLIVLQLLQLIHKAIVEIQNNNNKNIIRSNETQGLVVCILEIIQQLSKTCCDTNSTDDSPIQCIVDFNAISSCLVQLIIESPRLDINKNIAEVLIDLAKRKQMSVESINKLFANLTLIPRFNHFLDLFSAIILFANGNGLIRRLLSRQTVFLLFDWLNFNNDLLTNRNSSSLIQVDSVVTLLSAAFIRYSLVNYEHLYTLTRANHQLNWQLSHCSSIDLIGVYFSKMIGSIQVQQKCSRHYQIDYYTINFESINIDNYVTKDFRVISFNQYVTLAWMYFFGLYLTSNVNNKLAEKHFKVCCIELESIILQNQDLKDLFYSFATLKWNKLQSLQFPEFSSLINQIIQSARSMIQQDTSALLTLLALQPLHKTNDSQAAIFKKFTELTPSQLNLILKFIQLHDSIQLSGNLIELSLKQLKLTFQNNLSSQEIINISLDSVGCLLELLGKFNWELFNINSENFKKFILKFLWNLVKISWHNISLRFPFVYILWWDIAGIASQLAALSLNWLDNEDIIFCCELFDFIFGSKLLKWTRFQQSYARIIFIERFQDKVRVKLSQETRNILLTKIYQGINCNRPSNLLIFGEVITQFTEPITTKESRFVELIKSYFSNVDYSFLLKYFHSKFPSTTKISYKTFLYFQLLQPCFDNKLLKFTFKGRPEKHLYALLTSDAVHNEELFGHLKSLIFDRNPLTNDIIEKALVIYVANKRSNQEISQNYEYADRYFNQYNIESILNKHRDQLIWWLAKLIPKNSTKIPSSLVFASKSSESSVQTIDNVLVCLIQFNQCILTKERLQANNYRCWNRALVFVMGQCRESIEYSCFQVIMLMSLSVMDRFLCFSELYEMIIDNLNELVNFYFLNLVQETHRRSYQLWFIVLMRFLSYYSSKLNEVCRFRELLLLLVNKSEFKSNIGELDGFTCDYLAEILGTPIIVKEENNNINSLDEFVDCVDKYQIMAFVYWNYPIGGWQRSVSKESSVAKLFVYIKQIFEMLDAFDNNDNNKNQMCFGFDWNVRKNLCEMLMNLQMYLMLNNTLQINRIVLENKIGGSRQFYVTFLMYNWMFKGRNEALAEMLHLKSDKDLILSDYESDFIGLLTQWLDSSNYKRELDFSATVDDVLSSTYRDEWILSRGIWKMYPDRFVKQINDNYQVKATFEKFQKKLQSSSDFSDKCYRFIVQFCVQYSMTNITDDLLTQYVDLNRMLNACITHGMFSCGVLLVEYYWSIENSSSIISDSILEQYQLCWQHATSLNTAEDDTQTIFHGSNSIDQYLLDRGEYSMLRSINQFHSNNHILSNSQAINIESLWRLSRWDQLESFESFPTNCKNTDSSIDWKDLSIIDNHQLFTKLIIPSSISLDDLQLIVRQSHDIASLHSVIIQFATINFSCEAIKSHITTQNQVLTDLMNVLIGSMAFQHNNKHQTSRMIDWLSVAIGKFLSPVESTKLLSESLLKLSGTITSQVETKHVDLMCDIMNHANQSNCFDPISKDMYNNHVKLAQLHCCKLRGQSRQAIHGILNVINSSHDQINRTNRNITSLDKQWGQLHMHALSQLNAWNKENTMFAAEKMTNIIKKNVNLEIPIKLDPETKCFDYYNLMETTASFYYNRYVELHNTIRSSEYKQHQNLIQDYKNATNSIKQNDILSKSKFARLLTSQINFDEEYMDLNQKDLDEAALIAFQCYIECIKYSFYADLRIFRLIDLWFANSSNVEFNSAISKVLDQLETYKFLDVFPQLCGRILYEGNNGDFYDILNQLIINITNDHPYHTIYNLLAIVNSKETVTFTQKAGNKRLKVTTNTDIRMKTANQLLTRLLKGKQSKLILKIKRLMEAYIEFAEENNKELPIDKPLNLPSHLSLFKLCKDQLELPIVTSWPSIRQSDNYMNNGISCVPLIVKISRNYKILAGVNRPKLIELTASNGMTIRQLIKSNDDLRQDCVMQQIFSIVSRLLNVRSKCDISTSSYQQTNCMTTRGIRGYRVIPTSALTGVIEWCDGTISLGQWLLKAHLKYYPNDLKPDKCRMLMYTESRKSKSARLKVYQDICSKIQPVLGYYLLEKSQNVQQWLQLRLNYTESLSINSMVGYLLGLGDRHPQNILIDTTTAELIHIDLGIAFDQAELLPTPEQVPFRLTRDMLHALGPVSAQSLNSALCNDDATLRGNALDRTNYFIDVCCRVLRNLRHENSRSILETLLQVLLSDPFHNWSAIDQIILQNQDPDIYQKQKCSEIDSTSRRSNKIAERILIKFNKKLTGNNLNVEGQVLYLIEKATNPTNLSLMYCGWQPYL